MRPSAAAAAAKAVPTAAAAQARAVAAIDGATIRARPRTKSAPPVGHQLAWIIENSGRQRPPQDHGTCPNAATPAA